MFGTSHNSSEPPKDHAPTDTAIHTPQKPTGPGSIPKNLTLQTDSETLRDSAPSDKRNSTEQTPSSRRRSSGISKAGALFSSAKHSLHLSSSSHPHTSSAMPSSPTQQPSPLQKLGKTDPALSVPQGSLNNSAGESRPGPRSTFRVGVTEDKNRKCRRTMEDTHAYLYNFLSTPAPSIDTGSKTPASSTASADDPPSSSTSDNVVETDNGYFAIFDGHAGTFAADWCGKKLHVLLEDIIRKNPNAPIPELLDQTFTSVDQQLDKLPLKNSGCTAICAVLRWEDRIPNAQSATGSTAIAPAAAAVVKAVSKSDASSEKGDGSKDAAPNGSTDEPPRSAPLPAPQTPNLGPQMNALISSSTTVSSALPKLQESALRQRVLYTANVGDARIVLCRNGKALRLSYDHKGSDENEGKRITNAGGLILNNRVNGVLAVTRALGDAYMKDLVTGHPYTTETVIQADMDEFLILACDGLWDVCTDQEAVDLIRSIPDPQLASKTLVEHALSRFSTDNLSCMVVRFDAKSLLEARAASTSASTSADGAHGQHNQAHGQGNNHGHAHGAIENNSSSSSSNLIGVEGDPPSRKKGGISEVDKILGEARRGLDSSNTGGGDGKGDRGEGGESSHNNGNSSLLGIGEDAIREEECKEAGPELAAPPGLHLKGKGAARR